MGRESFRETNIPTGVESPVYLDARQIARGIGSRLGEHFAGEILGAGGAGGTLLDIPFQPAIIMISEATGPLLQVQLPGSAGAVDINMITGAAAGTAIPAATAAASALPGHYDLALPTGLAPDGDTVSVWVIGFREADGSL